MPSDTEITDSDSSILDTEITLDPEIIAISSLRWSELYKGVRSIFAILGSRRRGAFGDLAGGAGI
jgi:hypothetical protein